MISGKREIINSLYISWDSNNIITLQLKVSIILCVVNKWFMNECDFLAGKQL